MFLSAYLRDFLYVLIWAENLAIYLRLAVKPQCSYLSLLSAGIGLCHRIFLYGLLPL